MRKMKVKILLVSLSVLAIGLAGCGSFSKEEQLQTAVQQIENYEYEEALATLEAAMEAGEDKQMIARNKGIALSGLTRYDEAAVCFFGSIIL